MKIGFWQYSQGHGCSTSNLISVAMQIALNTKLKSAIMQTQYRDNNLIYAVMGKDVRQTKNSDSFDDVGLDEIIRLVKSGKATRESFISTTFSYISNRLNLVLDTQAPSEELYYKDLNEYATGIFDAFAPIYDVTFIDIDAGDTEISRKLLDTCDYIVCSLEQNKLLLNKTFKQEYLDYSKTIFVIGNYDNRLALNEKNILREYDKLNSSNLFVLPTCPQFANALNSCEVLKFFMLNKLSLIENNPKGKDEILIFMQELKKLTDGILVLLGYGDGVK
jgi:hypothetical protein